MVGWLINVSYARQKKKLKSRNMSDMYRRDKGDVWSGIQVKKKKKQVSDISEPLMDHLNETHP